jgi:ribose-phosphate pyrophosphokinase
MENHFSIISTPQDQSFARKIADKLSTELHIAQSDTFSSGEVIAWPAQSVRSKYIFIVHQYNNAVNDELTRIKSLISACRGASPEKIFLISPFLPYMRQDYQSKPRQPITAKTITAKGLDSCGLNEIITVDLHSKQAVGFFDTPVMHIGGSTLFTDYLKRKISTENLIIASADIGGAERATKFADKLPGTGMAFMHKTRPAAGQIGSVSLVGDVSGKDVMLVDDMTDSGNTISRAAETLYEKGALSVSACITHLLHKSQAVDNLGKSRLKKIFVTNSFSHEELPNNFEVLDLSDKLAEVISAILDKRPANIY